MLVPLAALPEGSIVDFTGAPKVFLLRSLAIALTALTTIHWLMTFTDRSAPRSFFVDRGKSLISDAIVRVRKYPIVLAAMAVVAANLISFMFSPLMNVSWAGFAPGFDSYSLLSVLPYFVVFSAIAAHLRTEVQLRRLLWALTVSSILLGIYGVGERFGVELFSHVAEPSQRVTLTFGNAMFSASYMLMTIPLVLGLWQSYRARFSAIQHVVLGAALIALQVFSVAFSMSRGPNIGMAFGLIAFVALVAMVYGRKAAIGPVISIGLAFVFTISVNFIPVPGLENSSSQLQARASTVGAAFTTEGGGLTGRYATWEKSWQIFSAVPWVNTNFYPELPSLQTPQLRQVFGYGPDVFGDIYQVAGGSGERTGSGILSRHAHNFPIHTLIELGLLGFTAYAALIAAVVSVLWVCLRAAHRAAKPSFIGYLAIGLSAVLAARLLEQMAGKAQISDLMLSWVLAGVVASVAAMQQAGSSATSTQSSQSEVSFSPVTKPGRKSVLSLVKAFSALITVVAVVIWWHVPLTDSRSLVLTARGQNAASENNLALTGELYRKAVAIAPDGPAPRLFLVQGLINTAYAAPDAASASVVLAEAYDLAAGVLDRHPLSYQAWQFVALISQMQARKGLIPWATAIKDNQIAAHVNPGQWPPLEQLSRTFILAGQFDAALKAARAAEQLGAANDPDGYFIFYIEATLEANRGNFAASDTALAILENFMHPEAQALVNDVKALPR